MYPIACYSYEKAFPWEKYQRHWCLYPLSNDAFQLNNSPCITNLLHENKPQHGLPLYCENHQRCIIGAVDSNSRQQYVCNINANQVLVYAQEDQTTEHQQYLDISTNTNQLHHQNYQKKMKISSIAQLLAELPNSVYFIYSSNLFEHNNSVIWEAG